MNIQKYLIVSLLSLLALTSCRHREVAYISDAQRDSATAIMEVYTATILPGDQLYIHVASMTPESVIPFNQETHHLLLENNQVINLDTNQRGVISQQQSNLQQATKYISTNVSGYTVTEKGTINFPILGQITVVGLTQDSLCHYLEKRLKDEGYVNDPQVTMDLMNFRVTVVGEVRNPQQIHVQGTRLTILEALAICGDITEYGQRENLVIVRDNNGQKEIAELDLTKKEMLESPYYYLHNNDIVYVEPNDVKKRDSDRNPDIPRYITIGISIWSLIRTSIEIARHSN